MPKPRRPRNKKMQAASSQAFPFSPAQQNSPRTFDRPTPGHFFAQMTPMGAQRQNFSLHRAVGKHQFYCQAKTHPSRPWHSNGIAAPLRKQPTRLYSKPMLLQQSLASVDVRDAQQRSPLPPPPRSDASRPEGELKLASCDRRRCYDRISNG